MIPSEFEGVMYGGPDRHWWMHCDRCGRLRLFGQSVEMHPSLDDIKAGAVWWHECLLCALETMGKRAER